MVSTLLQAAATATTAVPPDVWGIAGRLLTTILGVGGTALLFTWRAIGRAWFCAMLTACRPNLKEAIDTIYAERITEVDAGVAMAGQHDDKLIALEASVLAQGKALSDRLAENAEQHTDALREITKTLQEIRRDGNMTSSAVKRIEGFLDGVRAGASGWTGGDRREPVR
jgi:hypothetical protein